MANRSLFALAEFLIDLDRTDRVSAAEPTVPVPSRQSDEPVDREPADSAARVSPPLVATTRAA